MNTEEFSRLRGGVLCAHLEVSLAGGELRGTLLAALLQRHDLLLALGHSRLGLALGLHGIVQLLLRVLGAVDHNGQFRPRELARALQLVQLPAPRLKLLLLSLNCRPEFRCLGRKARLNLPERLLLPCLRKC